MKKKLFVLIFAVVSLIGLTAFRTSILGNCIDCFNGFFNPGYGYMRIVFAVVLAVVLAVIAVVVFTDKEYPGSPRRSSKVIAVTNLGYALFIVVDSFTLYKKGDSVWGYIHLVLFLLLAAFMVYYAICMFTYKKASVLLSIVPLVYFVYRLCYVFINSFGIIKSSEITLKIVALIFCVLFFEFYARYVSKNNFKRIRTVTLLAGIGLCITCVIASLPDLIAPIIYSDVTSRISISESTFLIATAVYTAIFLIASYSKKELYSSYNKDKENVDEIVSETIDI